MENISKQMEFNKPGRFNLDKEGNEELDSENDSNSLGNDSEKEEEGDRKNNHEPLENPENIINTNIIISNDNPNNNNNSSDKVQNLKSQIESDLLKSIQNRENTTKQRLELAESIGFKNITDNIVELDQFGFQIKDSSQNSNPSTAKMTAKEALKLNARIEKWQHMLNNYKDFTNKKIGKLKERARKGVPDSLRSMVWPLFSDVPKYFQKDLFKSLDSVPCEGQNETVIIKDLDRTFPLCQFFKNKYGDGQRKLYRVLSNYSKYNTTTGYVQGMGFIAALFLTYTDEETSFYCLDSLMKNSKYKMENLYSFGFPGLNKILYVYLNLLKKFSPKVYNIIRDVGLLPSGYAAQWFITCFTDRFNFEYLVRIFDTFLLEGYKVIYRIALALIKKNESKIIENKGDIVNVMGVINNLFDNIGDVDSFLNVAFGFHITYKQIEQYEKDYEKNKENKQNEFIMQL